MHRNFCFLGLVALCAAACSGDKDPEPCPALPPCIAGSTYNATTCACVLEDEVPDAADAHPKSDAGNLDEGFDAEPASDAAIEATDASAEGAD